MLPVNLYRITQDYSNRKEVLKWLKQPMEEHSDYEWIHYPKSEKEVVLEMIRNGIL